MYKASVRALMRYSIRKLNEGDYSLLVKLARPDFELAFPGDNELATMFRPQQRSRSQHATHRGIAEASAFADQIIADRIQFVIEDILVNGPPWNTRVALRLHSFISATPDVEALADTEATHTQPSATAHSDRSDLDSNRSDLGNNRSDLYNNRAILFLEVSWGRVVRWEDYEDTERVAAFDAIRSVTVATPR